MDSKVESRRSFIKKMAYSTPTIIALGTMTIPNSANASYMSRNEYLAYKKIYKQNRKFYNKHKHSMDDAMRSEYEQSFDEFKTLKQTYKSQKK